MQAMLASAVALVVPHHALLNSAIRQPLAAAANQTVLDGPDRPSSLSGHLSMLIWSLQMDSSALGCMLLTFPSLECCS
jgi:hypothetical protein